MGGTWAEGHHCPHSPRRVTLGGPEGCVPTACLLDFFVSGALQTLCLPCPVCRALSSPPFLHLILSPIYRQSLFLSYQTVIVCIVWSWKV